VLIELNRMTQQPIQPAPDGTRIPTSIDWKAWNEALAMVALVAEPAIVEAAQAIDAQMWPVHQQIKRGWLPEGGWFVLRESIEGRRHDFVNVARKHLAAPGPPVRRLTGRVIGPTRARAPNIMGAEALRKISARYRAADILDEPAHEAQVCIKETGPPSLADGRALGGRIVSSRRRRRCIKIQPTRCPPGCSWGSLSSQRRQELVITARRAAAMRDISWVPEASDGLPRIG
jgi:hypothetical protein